jgi:hypothetical protein
MTPNPSQYEQSSDASIMVTEKTEIEADNIIMEIEVEEMEQEMILLENEKTITSMSSAGTMSNSSDGGADTDDRSTTLLLDDDNDTKIQTKPSILASMIIHPLPPDDEKHIRLNLELPMDYDSSSQFATSRGFWHQVCKKMYFLLKFPKMHFVPHAIQIDR